jgi:hypothetical protein
LAANVTAAVVWGGTAIALQGSELATTLGAQIDRVLSWLNQHGIEFPPESIGALADRASPPQSRGAAPTIKSILPDIGGLFGPAWAAVATILGGLGDALVIVFLGLFLAAQPRVYRDASSARTSGLPKPISRCPGRMRGDAAPLAGQTPRASSSQSAGITKSQH